MEHGVRLAVADGLRGDAIELAMLDVTGGTRGSETNEVALLQQA